jgi:hypothetical protein
MLATGRWQVNRGSEKSLCSSCEGLLVGDTIGAKLEGWQVAMGTKSALLVIREVAASGRLTRREMVRRLMAGMGAGAAWPFVAASHPIHRHLVSRTIFDEAEKLADANWKPVFLSAEQNETVVALAEVIVPGSTKAQVNRFIDLLLNVDTTEHKKEFLDSIVAFEAESRKHFGKRFPSLEASQQNMLLTDAANAPAGEDSAGGAAKENSGLHGHFESLKGWISGAYYSSEAGMRELGWTGDYVYERFPGCNHTEGHH